MIYKVISINKIIDKKYIRNIGVQKYVKSHKKESSSHIWNILELIQTGSFIEN